MKDSNMKDSNLNYNIRLATLSDCKLLSQVKQKMWNETYRGIYSDEIIDSFNYKDAENTFKKILNNKDILLYVVESNNSIVGYMSVGVPVWKFRDYKQEIGLLYLRRSVQRIGIGKKLFELAQSIIKENGYSCFFVSCNKYNLNARKFYEKMGGKLVYEDDDNSNENKRFIQAKYHFDI